MSASSSVRVLFVCMGNICRSPAAEGVFKKLVAEGGLEEQIDCDSAGTHSYHIGDQPDPRSIQACRQRGIRLSHKARQVAPKDFDAFDHVVVMDDVNLRDIRRHMPKGAYKAELRKLTTFWDASPLDHVPDPYYGSAEGFEEMMDLLEPCCAALLREVVEKHGLKARA